MLTISVKDIIYETTADGPGFRNSVYCAGCYHECPGCHNPSTWSMHNGKRMSIDEIYNLVATDEFADVTFTGGDPMYQALAFTELAKRIKNEAHKTIWCYTGFLYERLIDMPEQRKLLDWIDVLVDGPFIEKLKDPDLKYRGSSNQRLIDVQKSLSTGVITVIN